MSKGPRRVLQLAIILAVAVTLTWLVVRDRNASTTEAEPRTAAPAPSGVRTKAGRTVISLDAAAQARNGIQVSGLKAATRREAMRANALVLQIQDLTTLRANYLTAATQVQKAQADLDVSSREYQRLKKLFQENQNASAKSVEAAEGAWRSDQAALKAAADSLALSERLAAQSWGEVVAAWLASGSPALGRILAQQDSLLQMSLPPGFNSKPPVSAMVEMPDDRSQPAKLVSSFPRVDPRIQTPTYLYLTPTRAGLTPGMTPILLLSSGPLRKGVIVPAEAVVWWQGKAWAYAKTAPERFVRREVTTDTAAGDGWFVTGGLAPGDQVVTSGGQQLLSIESTTPAQASSGEDEGNTD